MQTQNISVLNFSAPVPFEGIGSQQLPEEGGQQRLKRGDTRSDGRRFVSYIHKRSEYWVTEERFLYLQEYAKHTREKFRKANPHYMSQWNAKNARRRKKLRRASYLLNYKKERLGNKRWKENNPEKIREIQKRKRKRESFRPFCREKKKAVFRLFYFSRVGAAKRSDRPHEADAARFLRWMSAQVKGFSFSSYEVDHLAPMASMTWATIGRVNAPENVRWVTMQENRAKGDRAPSFEELFSHLMLVDFWKLLTKIHE